MQDLNGYQGESPCLAIKIKETSSVLQVIRYIVWYSYPIYPAKTIWKQVENSSKQAITGQTNTLDTLLGLTNTKSVVPWGEQLVQVAGAALKERFFDGGERFLNVGSSP